VYTCKCLSVKTIRLRCQPHVVLKRTIEQTSKQTRMHSLASVLDFDSTVVGRFASPRLAFAFAFAVSHLSRFRVLARRPSSSRALKDESVPAACSLLYSSLYYTSYSANVPSGRSQSLHLLNIRNCALHCYFCIFFFLKNRR
jgi:hypothetical protein